MCYCILFGVCDEFVVGLLFVCNDKLIFLRGGDMSWGGGWE